MASNVYSAMIELQFLNNIFKKNSISSVILNGVDETYFTLYKEQFEFIRDYFNEYNQLPSKETFQAKFTDNWEWVSVTDPEDYLVKKLKETKLFRDIIPFYKNIGELIKNEKTDEAVELMASASQQFMKQTTGGAVDLITEAQKRYDSYIERVNNPSSAFVTTGLKELDNILGGWDRQNESAIICARTGLGKCHEKGTEVLMADGTKKRVEDIVVGDKVQSIKGVNTVLDTHNGVSNGYRIIPSNGDPFVVSSDHIMSLWRRNVRCVNRRAYYDGTGEIVDISVEDFLKLSNKQKYRYLIVKPPVSYPQKNLSIDPYILGLWLGDGTSCRAEITTMDSEILEEWDTFAKSFGASLHLRWNGSKAKTYSITYGKYGRSKPNQVVELFKSLNVLDNKHIPLEYLTSSREQRLQLLAGLIDTDGHLDKNETAYTFSLKDSQLPYNIVQLARGLGLKATIHDKIVVGKVYKSVYISGQLCDIPCRLPRKKAVNQKKHTQKDYTHTVFKIEPVPRVEYYGFACDGDHRFLLGDNTLSHNSWFTINFALSAAKAGLRVGYYSGEMEKDLIGYRLDTFEGNIANGSLTHGNANVKEQYKSYIESLPKVVKGNVFCFTPDDLGGTATVSKLRAVVEKYSLDMLCVDQLSLLDDERHGRTTVDQFANLSKDLRKLQRMKKIPIICACQLNREEFDEGLSTRNIAGSDRIGQDSTTALFIERKGDNVVLTVGKARNAKSGDKLTYAWNINMGVLHYIPTENDAQNGDGVEELEYSYNTDLEKSDSVF